MSLGIPDKNKKKKPRKEVKKKKGKLGNHNVYESYWF